MKPIVCIDLDGVILQAETGGAFVGELMPGAWEAINAICRWARIVVLTARPPDQHPAIGRYLLAHGIAVDRVTNVKPAALFYIDDWAIHFTSWRAVLRRLDESIGTEAVQRRLEHLALLPEAK